MKALVFVTLACLLAVPAVAAEPAPPCDWTDVPCWWGVVEDNTPLPVCENDDIDLIHYICTEVIPPP